MADFFWILSAKIPGFPRPAYEGGHRKYLSPGTALPPCLICRQSPLFPAFVPSMSIYTASLPSLLVLLGYPWPPRPPWPLWPPCCTGTVGLLCSALNCFYRHSRSGLVSLLWSPSSGLPALVCRCPCLADPRRPCRHSRPCRHGRAFVRVRMA